MPSQAIVALVAAAATAVSLAQASQPFGPRTDVAAQRGSYIFNAVYDSLRMYGSTVHPNGMSLYLATVPQGVLFHHGNGQNATPTNLDWLAYEIEHAEMFARSKMGGRGGPLGGFGGPPPPHPDDASAAEKKERFGHLPAQVALGGSNSDSHDGHVHSGDAADEGHGWLHIYRTTRPLQFLYLDGMSGNKDSSGVIDTQDYLLRAGPKTARQQATENPEPKPTGRAPGPPGEFARAEELCQLCADWDLQGVIRTEGAGTEIIKCDFFDGLEEVQSLRRSDNAKGPGGGPGGGGPGGGGPGRGGPGGGGPGGGPDGDRGRRPGGPGGGPGGPGGGPWGRPSGPFNPENGFRDVGGHRTLLDYSSMVSAFFFPVNLTNPDPERASYPRLVGATTDELVAIKAYLAEVVAARRGLPLTPFSWRDVADLVVRRYAPRLTALANSSASATAEELAGGIQSALNVFLDYSVADEAQREAEARARCATFYLQTKLPLAAGVTDADRFIYAGFEAVNAEICGTLFDALKTVSDADASTAAAAVATAKASLKQLIAYLGWSVFET